MKVLKRLEESMWGTDENNKRIYYLWGKPGEAVYENIQLGKLLKIFNQVLIVLYFSVTAVTIFLVSEGIINFDQSDLIINFFFLGLTVIFLFELYIISKYCNFYLIKKEKRKKKSIKTWLYFSVIPILMLLDLNNSQEGFYTKTLPAIILFLYILGLYLLAFCVKTRGYIFKK